MNQHVPQQELESEAAYLAPWSKTLSEFFVPDRFLAAIGMHLRANFAAAAANLRPALMLAVQGPPGEGKTEMVNLCCAHLGCNVFHLSAAAMAGEHEGDARQVLLRTVAAARRTALSNDRPAVLVIDDMDRGVASLTNRTGHTINSGLLVGALQGLANDMQSRGAAVPTARVPVIMTANSFASLPSSLVRPGRTRFFTWTPTWQEKAEMVLPLFAPTTSVEESRLRRLVKRYHAKSEPLAFFVHLRHEYAAALAPWPLDCSDILIAADEFSRRACETGAETDFRLLYRVADELHSTKALSFLTRGGVPWVSRHCGSFLPLTSASFRFREHLL